MSEVQTISREVVPPMAGLTPQRLHASPDGYVALRSEVARAYLLGASGDGTFNRLHRTFRFAQKEREWLELLGELLRGLGYRGWIYREGRKRQLYVLETSATFLGEFPRSRFETPAEQVAYVRGYFDAEGGVPRDPRAPLYVQFVQKDRDSLTYARGILEGLGIACGVIHNPSRRVDPDYWRFFVRRNGHQRFISVIGSWHPRKAVCIADRVKI
jgi:hypothetical protein